MRVADLLEERFCAVINRREDSQAGPHGFGIRHFFLGSRPVLTLASRLTAPMLDRDDAPEFSVIPENRVSARFCTAWTNASSTSDALRVPCAVASYTTVVRRRMFRRGSTKLRRNCLISITRHRLLTTPSLTAISKRRSVSKVIWCRASALSGKIERFAGFKIRGHSGNPHDRLGHRPRHHRLLKLR